MKNNKLNPVDKAIVDQIFQSIKVYITQFKKTPNKRLAYLIKIGCENLESKMNRYILNWEKEKNKKIKINGR